MVKHIFIYSTSQMVFTGYTPHRWQYNDAMSDAISPVAEIQRIGGHLCLDFTNTVHHRYRPQDGDYFTGVADVLQWAQDSDLIGLERRDAYHAELRKDSETADRFLEEVISLRESLFELFTSPAAEREIAARDLAVLNRALTEGAAWRRLVWADPHPIWQWSTENPWCIPWRLAWSASELLCSPMLARVKECPPPDGCGWLFLYRSKNRSRRWCSMRDCGNAAKAKRHYRRKKAKHRSSAETDT